MDQERQQELHLFIRKAFAVTGIALGLAALFFMRSLVLMFFLAILIAILWAAMARFFLRLTGHRGPRSLMVGFAVLFSLGIFAGTGTLLIVPLRDQIRSLIDELPSLFENFRDRIGPWLERFGLGDFVSGGGESTGIAGDALTQGFQALSVGVMGVVGLITVLFVAFFLALSPDLYRRGFLRLIPPYRRADVNRVLGDLHDALIQWLKAAGITMVFVGITTGVALWIIGVPYPLLFGVAAGVLELIPYIGPTLAFTGPFVLALTISFPQALWVLVAWSVVQSAEGNIITPAVMAKQVSLPPAMTIVAIVGMGQMFGFLGILLAPPALAVLLKVLEHVTPELEEEQPGNGGSETADSQTRAEKDS